MIALEAIRGVKEQNQLSGQYEARPIRIGLWEKTILENARLLFENKKGKALKEQQELVDRLYKIIGQRDIEIEWLKKNCVLTHNERRSLIDKTNPRISISRQADLLDISRRSVYRAPIANEEDIDIISHVNYLFISIASLSFTFV